MSRINWADTMSLVSELNKTHGVQQKGGKIYTQVVHRMEAMRQHHGISIGVTTEILVDDGHRVVMKATVHSNDNPPITLGTGHAEELRGEGMVNKTSAIENCETSAIGRALASVGLSGGEFASANEMDGVVRKTDVQVSTPKPQGVAKQKPLAQAVSAGPIKTGAEIAKEFIATIHSFPNVETANIWLAANMGKLQEFEKTDPANSKGVQDAYQKKLQAFANAIGEGQVQGDDGTQPVSAVTTGAEPDPTPAPLPDDKSEDDVPF